MSTCDLYDDYAEQLQVCTSPLRSYGKNNSCSGLIVTVKCYQDNSKVKSLLATPGTAKVLVVNGGADMEYALLGDLIATSAVRNGWSGIIINGAVRDIGELKKLDIHIKALGNVPRKTQREKQGIVGQPINFGNVCFEPNHWLYSDEEGLVTSEHNYNFS